MHILLRRIACLVAICSIPSGAQATTDWTVFLRRFGPFHLGMSLAEVRKAVGDPTAKLYGNEAVVPVEECAYLESRALKKGLGLMFAKGILVRIDIHEAGFRTASGAWIGDPEERIQQLYRGRIRVEPHHYDKQGHYLEYRPTSREDRRYGITFETDGKRVTSFRIGTVEAIALVEGCS